MMVWEGDDDGDLGRGILIGVTIGALMWVGIITLIRRWFFQ